MQLSDSVLVDTFREFFGPVSPLLTLERASGHAGDMMKMQNGL